ncbi:MAG TPA: cobalamin biosynthesis protein [Thermotogota bacterium]|nr:cobalamin biosynthesis protein [Thermotogota bacterium]HPR95990.1 cobalamin biosynthesis protein [Thermotogota bacterium]
MKTALIKVRKALIFEHPEWMHELHGTLSERLEKGFSYYNRIVFVGSMGILIRKIKDHICSKMSDSAVVLLDEKRQFCIPVLSSHLGGAVDLCRELQAVYNCTPVFTTATDLNGKLGIDLFALRHKMMPDNHEGILKINSRLLSSQQIMIKGFPETFHFPEDYLKVSDEADVGFEAGGTILNLKKKNLVLGAGFHKDIRTTELYNEFCQLIPEEYQKRILILTSHKRKWNSRQFHGFARKAAIPETSYFENDALSVAIRELNLDDNEVVRRHMGVSHVSQPSAYLASKRGKELLTVKSRTTKFALFEMEDTEWMNYEYTRETVPEVLI